MDDKTLQHIINLLSLGSVYSLFALGYAMVFSVLGVLNLAHSAIFMFGAFIGILVVSKIGITIWLAMPIAMVGAGILSIVLERVAFYPLRKRNAPRISQLISSIGFAILLVSIAEILFQSIFGKQDIRFDRDLIPRTPIMIEGFDVRIRPIDLVIFITALLLMVALQYLVTRTKLGQAMRTVAFNERIASLLGINVSGVYLRTFFIAGALAGAAGVLYGLAFRIQPSMGQDVALLGLTAMVLGGLGSIPGTVVGGFIVAGLQEFSTAVGGSDLRNAVVFLLLFVILLVRPQGLLGQAEQDRA